MVTQLAEVLDEFKSDSLGILFKSPTYTLFDIQPYFIQ